MQLIDEYGYPLLKRQDKDGINYWYYPEASDEWNPHVTPHLIEGKPMVHILNGFKVCTFTPKGASPIVIVLSVKEIR